MQNSGRSWPISTNAARTDFNPMRHNAHGNGCAIHQIEKFSRDLVRERKQEMLAAMMQHQCDVDATSFLRLSSGAAKRWRVSARFRHKSAMAKTARLAVHRREFPLTER